MEAQRRANLFLIESHVKNNVPNYCMSSFLFFFLFSRGCRIKGHRGRALENCATDPLSSRVDPHQKLTKNFSFYFSFYFESLFISICPRLDVSMCGYLYLGKKYILVSLSFEKLNWCDMVIKNAKWKICINILFLEKSIRNVTFNFLF